MSLTHEQQAAAYANGSVAVTAGAGTGKTHMLSERYLHHLVADQRSPLEVVAVTFTEKAAAELRARIRDKVATAMPTRPEVLAELEAAPISTIHALASRICREHPESAGVPADFQVLDEQEGQLWIAEQLIEAASRLPEALFALVPYSLLVQVLPDLLADPVTAEQAFARVNEDWHALAARLRQEELSRLLADTELQQAHQVLMAYQGDPTDLIEGRRLEALQGLKLLQQEQVAEGLGLIRGVKLTGGSAKKWPGGGLPEVKAALKLIRERIVEALDEGLILLAPGPADVQLREMLPALQEAYETVRDAIKAAKRASRLLDFADLEVHALRALEDPGVREYYALRWKAYLIDEVQDTNPTQAALLARLVGTATLTVVGDEKQSIYGFRRADVAVFRRMQDEIQQAGGLRTELSQSFRTHHQLMDSINRVFEPVLGSQSYQALVASRQAEPHAGPHLEVFSVLVPDGLKPSKAERQRAEAREIARRLEKMLQSGLMVFDKHLGRSRPIRPGDIAVLSRAWGPLETYGEALAAARIPSVNAGGGDLMATREALDGLALLRFLADTRDDLALVAVLRSPFFAVGDPVLFRFSQAMPDHGGWWQALKAAPPADLAPVVAVLGQLLKQRRLEPPSRLLMLADQLTGYTAVIANMPGARRREADWNGFVSLMRRMEEGAQDVFQVVRRLMQLMEAEVELPRPALEAGDAVALMTVHASKGLEWPVVVVPDLTRRPQGSSKRVRFDAELGVALKLESDEEGFVQPVLWTVLEQRQARLEEAEQRRVFYVALTRVRDRLLLSAADQEKGGAMNFLKEGLEAADVPIGELVFDPADALPEAPPRPEALPEPRQWLLQPVGPGRLELPVTALSEYQRCPQRFRYHYLEGHPGLSEGTGYAARVGTLVHLGLELGLREANELKRFDPLLPDEALDDAVALVRRFDTDEAFEPFRGAIVQREQTFKLKLGNLTLNGIIDAVGPDWVLDYKTDRECHPDHHRFQVWAYAQATGHQRAHLAFLRHNRVETFEAAQLEALSAEAQAMAKAILAGRFEPTPSLEACIRCPYAVLCDAQRAVAPIPAVNPLLTGWRQSQPLGAMSAEDWEKAPVVLAQQQAWAQLWELVQTAPARYAARLLTTLADAGWKPTEAVEAFTQLTMLARACEPQALASMPPAVAGKRKTQLSLAVLAEEAPYALTREQAELVEAGYAALTLEPAHQAWVSFWTTLMRWHLRFDIDIDEVIKTRLPWSDYEILLEEG